MNASLISILSIILYIIGAALLAYRLFHRYSPPRVITAKAAGMVPALMAITLHGIVLFDQIYTAAGLSLGLTNAASLVTWLIATLFLLASVSKPVENLGIIILPCGALALAMELMYPSSRVISGGITRELEFHILISILAYSVLSIAAVQAILLAVQDHHLRHKHPSGFIRALPPLQTMESLLFQMIGVGFVLHTLSLITGALYLQNMFAQHLVHKTVLSIIAWFVFAALLWGRYHYGWRGKTAIRWTMGGFVMLFLAYFGTKLALEVFLKR